MHLQADLKAAVEWANTHDVAWAFTDNNAGAYWVNFYNSLENLDKINWDAVTAKDFRDSKVRDGKQAEFLMFGAFPWTLVEKVGTINNKIAAKVQKSLMSAQHKPDVIVRPHWYF